MGELTSSKTPSLAAPRTVAVCLRRFYFLPSSFLSAVCVFPYIMGFNYDSIEIRLIINGNLVHNLAMPKLKLITSKSDIFFVSTTPEFFQVRKDTRVREDGHSALQQTNSSAQASQASIFNRDSSISPPSSPHCKISSRVSTHLAGECLFLFFCSVGFFRSSHRHRIGLSRSLPPEDLNAYSIGRLFDSLRATSCERERLS